MSAPLSEAWTAAIAAAPGPVESTVLRLASEGHPNARAYVEAQIAECDDTRCPCGADELCEGVALPDRTAYRAALREVIAVMDRGGHDLAPFTIEAVRRYVSPEILLDVGEDEIRSAMDESVAAFGGPNPWNAREIVSLADYTGKLIARRRGVGRP